ncbi:MAG: type IV secretion system DNA-binding domain-containing protein [Patescibacteria group bacterium]|nr:type IV secretion system DNA-binding domain-containing protein [Patescibacteria group bacterium]MDD5715290.1 type IV secretion system DNA-binding domain-containing protein [Patescibacteria group bacterium]
MPFGSANTGGFSELLANPAFTIILVSLAALCIVAGALGIIMRRLRSQRALPLEFHKVFLLVTLPKEAAVQEEEGRQRRTVPELLADAEAWFTVLGGMKAERGMGSYIAGRHDHFSLEIVALHGLISFYVVVPRYLQQYMEQHIHAQYPDAQIEEVDEYNLFHPTSAVTGTAFKFKKPYIFPIRTYKQLDIDPLNSITNALSKVAENEGIAIQYVVRSAKAQWHNWGAHAAREMHMGKKLKDAVGRRGFVGFIVELARTFFPKKKKEEFEPTHQLSPREEEIAKSLEDKTSKAGMEVNIRIVVAAQSKERAQAILKNLENTYSQFTLYEYGNGLVRKGVNTDKLVRDFIYRRFMPKCGLILNTEEMTSVFHFPLPTTETPNIRWLTARKAPPPPNIPTEGLVLGHCEYRGQDTIIRIKQRDRQRHVYVIGKSGVGKSVLLSNMIIQDILNGEGVGVVDPHGDLINDILPHIPRERAEDVIHFNPSDMGRPIGLNMLEARSPEEKDFAVQEMVAIFYKLFPPEMIGPMFEHNMRNVMLTLMEDEEHPGTIAEIPRMFTDPAYQKYKLAKVKDPIVRAFWEKEMAKTSDFHKSEMLGYLISKVGRFVENSMMRNIIGQEHSGFDFDEVMNKKKILLVNLAKGTTGEVNSNLLGLIIVSKLQMAAMRRVSMPQEQRSDFYLYIDEFQNFVTDSIATILSEARKYHLNLTMAHQYVGQLVRDNNDTKIRDAVFGNAGTLIAFRVGVDDAEILAKEFEPVFNEYDVINVDMYTANAKLLIDNTSSKPFNMKTYPPQPGSPEMASYLIELSRMKYGRDRKIVEEETMEKSRLGQPAATQGPSMGVRNV